MKTPTQGASKLRSGFNSGGQNYRDGVNNVQTSPMAKAADNAEKWFAGIQAAYQSGKWAERTRSVTLQAWKTKTANEGATRWQGSAERAEQNYLKFAQQFYPHLETVQQEVEAMPSMTLDDNIARMVHNARRVSQFSYTRT